MNNNEVLARGCPDSQARHGPVRRPGEESPKVTTPKGLHYIECHSQCEETAKAMYPSGPLFLIYTGAAFSTLRDVRGVGRKLKEGSTMVLGAASSLDSPPRQWFSKWVPQRHRILESYVGPGWKLTGSSTCNHSTTTQLRIGYLLSWDFTSHVMRGLK